MCALVREGDFNGNMGCSLHTQFCLRRMGSESLFRMDVRLRKESPGPRLRHYKMEQQCVYVCTFVCMCVHVCAGAGVFKVTNFKTVQRTNTASSDTVLEKVICPHAQTRVSDM